MAEWSKALVSGTSHFDDVGSNPTTAIRAEYFKTRNRKKFWRNRKSFGTTDLVLVKYDSRGH